MCELSDKVNDIKDTMQSLKDVGDYEDAKKYQPQLDEAKRELHEKINKPMMDLIEKIGE